jgi:hypothetical protein
MVEAAAPIDAAAAPVMGGLSAGRRRYVLTLLMIAYTLSFLDRQVLSILVEPIKTELHVGDALMGLLTGPVSRPIAPSPTFSSFLIGSTRIDSTCRSRKLRV